MNSKAKQLETLLVIVLALVIAGRFTNNRYLPSVAIVLGVAGLLVPPVALGIHWCWSMLSQGLGWLSAKGLLSIAYILVLIPLSVLARRLGKLGMNTRAGGHSCFKERNH